MLRAYRLLTVAGLLLLACAGLNPAAAQPLPGPTAPTAANPALQSPAWRRTLHDFDEWASVQKVYNAGQIKQYRAQIVDKAARLSGSQLNDFQDDLNEKLHVLMSAEARAARKWLGDTLAVASDSYAKEIKAEYPDVAKLTASQIEEQLAELADRRAGFRKYRQDFERLRKVEVDTAIADDRRQADANQAALNSVGNYSGYNPGGPAYNYNRPGGGYGYTPLRPVLYGGFRW